ncbi:MAG TPA: TolC family protein, partial [Candidatus Eisenbacteria bacterium]|nr:TolC family protein [Candidatus Eisenbacteria bacterium]
LTLADAVALASGGAPAVQLADLRAREAVDRVGQARASLLPQLTGTASAVNRTYNFEAQGIQFPKLPGVPAVGPVIGPLDNVDARVTVRQSLVDLSAWQRLRAADRFADAGREDLASSAEAAAQAAALAYLRAARAQALVGARQADLDLSRELLELAREQQAAGTSPAIDTTRAGTQVAAARGALVLAENQLERARIDLARTLGLDPSTPLALADTLGEGLGASDAPQDPAAAVTFALAHRAELPAEQARLARARAQRSAIALERLPRLEAEADWGDNGQHTSDWLATRQYGVALTLPLVDGFGREARLAEQARTVAESEVRARDLRDQVAAEVRGALLDLESGREQLAIAADRLRLAAEEVAQARERFTNGVAGNIEVITAQASLLDARNADIDARYAAAAARVTLARAAGVARAVR